MKGQNVQLPAVCVSSWCGAHGACDAVFRDIALVIMKSTVYDVKTWGGVVLVEADIN